MKKNILTLIILVLASNLFAQQVPHEIIQLKAPGIINFDQLVKEEKLHPIVVTAPVDVEADEDLHQGIPKKHRVKNPVVTQTVLPTSQERTISPAPTATFNGLTDNNALIPPDVAGAAGPNHLFETINSQYRIFNKSGGTVSTLSLSSFWSGVSGSGSPFCDPHVIYDPNTSKWYTILLANLSNGHSGFFLAVSQSNDPTGSWWEYSIDAQGSTTNWMDYPAIGFNDNWIVVTGNMFTSSNFFSTTKIFVFNKSSVTSGSAGTVTSFSDNSIFSLEPAATYDAGVTTEYMLTEWNNNSGGNCYVKVFTITGSQSSPVYNAGNTIGTNQPYSATPVDALQLGSTHRITTDDSRMRSVIYRNGSLYGAQTVYLPSTSPNRASCQVWQIDPAASTLQNFFRVDDGTGTNFYYYPSVSVNANSDVLVGYTLSSSSIYASAGYSYRTSADAANTLQSSYTYKNGQASYYKTYGGTRNRWGDYSQTSTDPSDGSFWTLQEFAYTPANEWGTVWAGVAASTGTTCATPAGLNATSITETSATLNWSSVGSAVSYNIQYRNVGNATWTSTTSTGTSKPISGLTPLTQYEFQVQSDCGGGTTSSFSASANFTTLNAATCDVPSGLNATSVTSSSATLNWSSVTGAVSYNVQYRNVGNATWTSTTSTSTSKPISSLLSNTQYEFQVQTVCASGNSSFSSSTNFTTLSSGGSCTNTPEPNESKTASSTISVGTDILSQIGTSSDVDWFSFANTSTNHNIKVTLTTLPANYDISLYKSNGNNAVGTSSNGGTTNETIIYNTSNVGTYKVKVNGVSNAFNNSSCYTLHVYTASSPFRLSEDELANDESAITLYPVPASNAITVSWNSNESGSATITIINTLGEKIYFESSEVIQGKNSFNLDLSKMVSGVYFCEVTNNGVSLRKQFVVEK